MAPAACLPGLAAALLAQLAGQAFGEADASCAAPAPAASSAAARGTVLLQRSQLFRKRGAIAEPPEKPAEPSESGRDLGLLGGRLSASSLNQCCQPFWQWPNVDHGVTCGGCRALVLTRPYGGRCDWYCQSFGHVCVAAAEEVGENCDVKYSRPCEAPIQGTSDMLCTCLLPSASATCPAAPSPVPLPMPAPAPTPAPGGSTGGIRVSGRQLLVNGRPVHLKGVCWSPVPKGGSRPSDVDFAGFVERDAELMARAGINAVRTYKTITDRHVLNALWARGIWVLNSVYNYGGDSTNGIARRVRAVKDHPAILMWTIGNEWNYNGLYVGLSGDAALRRVREAVQKVKEVDGTHPVASIYGEVPGRDVIGALADVDVWGVNVYRDLGFGDAFEKFARRSGKPLFLGEFGADAFNTNTAREDQESQARATTALTEEIVRQSAVLGGVCLGGFIFEFADEWWKDGDGSRHVHDKGGVAPGGGPYPDRTFNEEWWGLVTVDRTPRLAYDAYARIATPEG